MGLGDGVSSEGATSLPRSCSQMEVPLKPPDGCSLAPVTTFPTCYLIFIYKLAHLSFFPLNTFSLKRNIWVLH